MFFVAKVKNKDLYLNQSSYGIHGEETTYYLISKTPELHPDRSGLKETIDYFKSGFGKIVNDIDESTINDLEIKKVEIFVK